MVLLALSLALPWYSILDTYTGQVYVGPYSPLGLIVELPSSFSSCESGASPYACAWAAFDELMTLDFAILAALYFGMASICDHPSYLGAASAGLVGVCIWAFAAFLQGRTEPIFRSWLDAGLYAAFAGSLLFLAARVIDVGMTKISEVVPG